MHEQLTLGDKVEFTYHGSQTEAQGKRVKGTIVEFVPRISWNDFEDDGSFKCGGTVLADDGGYATDIQVIE